MTIGSFEEVDKLDKWVIKEYVQAMDLNSFPFHHLSARHSSQRNCAQETGSMARNFWANLGTKWVNKVNSSTTGEQKHGKSC